MAQKTYGLKEVADVKFYPSDCEFQIAEDSEGKKYIKVTKSGSPVKNPSYTFDSLKVSNIEVTSETTDARGGKGNPKLISWSYGKEATLSITDALLSMETLGLMFGQKEDTEHPGVITIDADSFPGTYLIVGETIMRPYEGGEKDEAFAFIIPKGHPQVGGTLTMEAEGDPSTFEMTIDALAADLGDSKNVLMQFVSLDDTQLTVGGTYTKPTDAAQA